MLLTQFAFGFVLILITVVIHGIALDRLIFLLVRCRGLYEPTRRCIRTKVTLMVLTILYVFFAHIVQIWLWALCYLKLGVLPDLESALYLSVTAFTTVGFGDLVLDKPWRLLTTFEAANGFILFGWSTAFIFEVMNRIYSRRDH